MLDFIVFICFYSCIPIFIVLALGNGDMGPELGSERDEVIGSERNYGGGGGGGGGGGYGGGGGMKGGGGGWFFFFHFTEFECIQLGLFYCF